jgi:hypothetical protein
MTTGFQHGRWLRAAVPMAFATVLVGCSMPNSSNPTLTISKARVNGDQALLDMHIDNPSDMDVRVDSIDWSLVYGPLPVAEGSWEVGTAIPSKGGFDFSRTVGFTSPALDTGADKVELSGTINLTTEGNSGETSLTGAGFVSDAKTGR